MRFSAKRVLKWLLVVILVQIMTIISFKLYKTVVENQFSQPLVYSTIQSLLQPDLSGMSHNMEIERPQILKRFMLPYDNYQAENPREGGKYEGTDHDVNARTKKIVQVDIDDEESQLRSRYQPRLPRPGSHQRVGRHQDNSFQGDYYKDLLKNRKNSTGIPVHFQKHGVDSISDVNTRNGPGFPPPSRVHQRSFRDTPFPFQDMGSELEPKQQHLHREIPQEGQEKVHKELIPAWAQGFDSFRGVDASRQKRRANGSEHLPEDYEVYGKAKRDTTTADTTHLNETEKANQLNNLPPNDDHDGTCTFQNCPKTESDAFNVHLIPHSHIDVGWLQTVDEYYSGGNRSVRNILHSVIKSLLKDPKRRFLFVEMAYFSRYWKSLKKKQRDKIRHLIKERRLELVNGGWVMSDAAVTMYNDIIDQHTLGFNFISDTFGPCAQTKTAWHVDQFGHSREHASLFAQMGYDSLFIGRIEIEDRRQKKMDQSLEFVWNTSPKNLRNKTTLFTSILYDGYFTPSELSLDHVMEKDYIFDPETEEEIKSKRSDEFIDTIHQWASSFQTNHILFSMSCDFCYSKSKAWYDMMDELIHSVRKKTQGKINVFYSTPSCYVYEVNKAKETFSTKEDDFLPYAQEEDVYWTGYFTTRPGLKLHVRHAGQILQSCKQLTIFAPVSQAYNSVDELRKAMAVLQHHDAITGTQPLIVRDDYIRILSNGTHSCEKVISMAYTLLFWSKELPKDGNPPVSQFCYNLNISECDILLDSRLTDFLVTIHNSLSWTVDNWVRIPINSNSARVMYKQALLIPCEIFPVPNGIRQIPGRIRDFTREIVFKARLPAMSTSTLKIDITSEPLNNSREDEKEDGDYTLIENEHLALKFSKITGLLMSILDKNSSKVESLSQDFSYYSTGPKEWTDSGHYVFYPFDFRTRILRGETPIVELDVKKGSLVEEVHQTFSRECSQVVRLYKGAKYVEFQWVAKPPNINLGLEVISRFSSSLKNYGVFYTDSNGREMMMRRKNKRPLDEMNPEKKVSGNYYPIASRMFIRDEAKGLQLTLLTDRSQGGSSLYEGSMELLIHRTSMGSDDKGVDEHLFETGEDKQPIIYTGKHYLCFGTIKESALLVKHLAMKIHFAPTIVFSQFTPGAQYSIPNIKYFLREPLPDNVQVLSLDRINANQENLLLLRLEHVFEAGEHSELSQPVEISLQFMFKSFVIMEAEETTLGGNFNLGNFTRLQWKTKDGLTSSRLGSFDYSPRMVPPFKVRLEPMEIRTFRIRTEKQK